MISLWIWAEGGKLFSHKPVSRAVAASPPAKAPINIPKILNGDTASTDILLKKKPDTSRDIFYLQQK
jgi:hypothetical protein